MDKPAKIIKDTPEIGIEKKEALICIENSRGIKLIESGA